MFTRRMLLCGVAALALFAVAVSAGKPKPPPPAAPAIAYLVNVGYDAIQGGDLWVMDADGSNQRLVHSGDHGCPAWSPDGAKLAFGAYGGIYVVNVDGAGLHRVVTTSSDVLHLDWSPVPAPDGNYKFTYQTWVDEDGDGVGTMDVFVSNVDGTGVVNLTNTTDARENNPVWSRNADKIAFSRQPGTVEANPHHIVVLELGSVDGELAVVAETNLTESGPLAEYHVMHPDWARTEDRLVVIASVDGPGSGVPTPYDLWIIDWSDPANPVEITAGFDPQNLRQPCWSPDDSQIIYNGGNDKYPTGSIWLIEADGRSKTELVRREQGSRKTNPYFPYAPNRLFPVWKR